jgi:hypothetical protein
MSSERWLVAMSVLGALGSGACADFSRGGPLAAGGRSEGSASNGSDAGSTLTYSADIQPLLLDACATCHSQSGAASDTEFQLSGAVLDDYASTLALVAVGSPETSRLLVKMSGRGHGGGATYPSTSPEYAIILLWVCEGAAP